MSKRVDITGQIFHDLYVLEFTENKNTHAYYKCLCMKCNETILVSYSNLISGNTKSCRSCGNKRVSNGVEQDICWELQNKIKICAISEKFNIGRGIVYRIDFS